LITSSREWSLGDWGGKGWQYSQVIPKLLSTPFVICVNLTTKTNEEGLVTLLVPMWPRDWTLCEKGYPRMRCNHYFSMNSIYRRERSYFIFCPNPLKHLVQNRFQQHSMQFVFIKMNIPKFFQIIKEKLFQNSRSMHAKFFNSLFLSLIQFNDACKTFMLHYFQMEWKKSMFDTNKYEAKDQWKKMHSKENEKLKESLSTIFEKWPTNSFMREHGK